MKLQYKHSILLCCQHWRWMVNINGASFCPTWVGWWVNRGQGPLSYLWLPCVADADIIFLPCGFFLLLSSAFFYSSPNLSGRRLDVYHTSTHGVALVW